MSEMESKKGIVYRPHAVKQLLEETGLNKMLSNITPVDFVKAIHADSPEIIARIEYLNDLLTNGTKSNYKDIRDELASLLPNACDMIPVIILNALEVSEKLNERVGLFEDGIYRIYTNENHYWKQVDEIAIVHFLVELAEKSGLSRREAIKVQNIKSLKENFNIHAKISVPEENPDVAKMNLLNGTFVVSKSFIGLREHQSDDYFNYILSFNYDPEAKCPLFMNYLDMVIPEKECQIMLSEFAGYPLSRGLKMEKAAVLIGPGGSGKSTFCDILTGIYGAGNVGSYSLSSLCGTKESCSYNRADLKKYILNYSTEMGGKDCDFNLVKKVISREPVEARKPYGEPFILRNYCPVMFNVNEMPPMENTSALWRRICIAPFNNQITENQMDVEFSAKLVKKESSGIFNWMLGGLQGLIDRKRFTVSPLGVAEAKRLRVENDNVLAFVEVNTYIPSTKKYVFSVNLYKDYAEFCKENNYRHLSCMKFLKRLEGLHIFVDRDAPNHNIRVYCEKQYEIDMQREKELEEAIKRSNSHNN